MCRSLLLSRPPLNDESLLGYLLWLVELNCYRKISWLFNLSKTPGQLWSKVSRSFLFSNSDLSRLANLVKTEESLLSHKLHPGNFESYKFSFFGHPVNYRSIHSLYPKICPACIRDFNYVKAVWDFSLVTCCPLHNCMLINICPSCCKRISWFRKKVAICRCGYDFRNSVLTTINQDQTLLSKSIYNLLFNSQYRSILPIPLQTASLGDLFTILTFFSDDHKKNRTQTQMEFSPSNFNIAECHKKLVNAINIFRDWPNSFYNFLSTSDFQLATKSGEIGIIRRFGKFYINLTDKIFPISSEIRNAFEKYTSTHLDDCYLSRLKWVKAPEISSDYNLQEASVFLGISSNKVIKLIETDELKGKIIQRGKRRFIKVNKFSAKVLRKILIKETPRTIFSKSTSNDLLTTNQVSTFLGIGRDSVNQLAAQGFLSALKIIKYNYSFPLYRKFEIENLLLQMDKYVQYPMEKKFSDFHTFLKTVQRLYSLNYTVADLIASILKREICPKYKQKKPGFSAYLFDITAISVYIRKKLQDGRTGGLQAKEYAKKLGITVQSIYSWMNRGYIKAIFDGNLRIGRLIPPISAIDFENTYILLTQVSNKTGIDHSLLLKFLSINDVVPVSGPKIDGCRNYLFFRNQVEKVDFSSLKTR
jgi:hypothetical protein